MRSSVRAILLVAGVLLAIAWFGHERANKEPTAISDDAEPAAAPAPATEVPDIARLNRPYEPSADGEPLESPAHASGDTSGIDTRSPSVDASISQTRTVASSPDTYAKLLPRPSSSTKETENDPSSEDQPATAFDAVIRFDCEFGEGYNSGLWDGKLQSMTASWQGGPVVYDSIDKDGGHAQMIGSPGATGSLKGQAQAQVASAADRVEFLSRLDNGHVVFTTVFGRQDEGGRYMAVMSRHEGGGNYLGSQFHGSCR